jgi:hypothetical protein
MKKYILIIGFSLAAQGHDIITTKITWDREISRIINARCASCHHDGGAAFSLMSYKEGRPWAVAIKEEVLERRMPPWGAVKGFGDFRNDQALTPEQLELIVSWAEGGAPEGEDKDLPPPPDFTAATPATAPPGSVEVSGEFKLPRDFTLDGLWPESVPGKASLQITAELPDGGVVPLLWLEGYRKEFGHTFLLRTPLDLPAGSKIHGVPPDARLSLFPAPASSESEKQTAQK